MMRIDMTFSLWHRAPILFALATLTIAADDARQKLILQLNAIADTHLEERARAIEKIQARADAELRQQQVRTKIRRMIGALPNTRAPLNARVVYLRKGAQIPAAAQGFKGVITFRPQRPL